MLLVKIGPRWPLGTETFNGFLLSPQNFQQGTHQRKRNPPHLFELPIITFFPVQEFIIHSPDFEAAKFWVGNMGKTATHAVVFAQLHMPGGQCHGLHPFVVQVGCCPGDSVWRHGYHHWGLLASSE